MKSALISRLLALTLLIGLGSLAAPLARGQAAESSADVSAVLSSTSVHAGDKATLAVVVNVHDGLHAQSHTPVDEFAIKFVLTPAKTDGVNFGDVQYPPGIEKNFPNLGKLNVYLGKTVLLIPVEIKADAKTGTLTLGGNVFFQACNDDSCFPPEKLNYSVDAQVVPAGAAVVNNPAFDELVPKSSPTPSTAPTTAPAAMPAPPTASAPPPAQGSDTPTLFGFDLDKVAWPFAFSAAFVVGIIFNLMPCVLPVLPLKIMGFYEVSQHDRSKSVQLGAVFSAGLISSFAVLALLVVGSAKLNWGGLFEHTWFTVSISVVLVCMAISTFGFFTVNVPNSLYSFTPRHDTFVGNFLFGILTAALSTPCTFGMFVALLAWALKQPAWIGGASIVMVGVGMAFPYFVLSAFPEVARKFPRTGPWPEVVKQFMGFLLLATALYFAQPLFARLPKDIFWWTLFGIIAAGGLFLIVRGIQLSTHLTARLISTAIALLLVVPTFYVVHRITEKPFVWIPYSDQALASATSSGNIVLIDFTADWCGNCHFLEAKVLHNSQVVHVIHAHNVVMLQADMTNQDAPARPLLDKLNSSGAGSIPLTAVYFPHQAEPTLLKGIYSADDLVKTLTQ